MNNSNRRFYLKCKLTRPFLGTRRDKDGYKAFDTEIVNGEVHYVPDCAQWKWAVRQAFEVMGLIPEVDPDYVKLPVTIKAPTMRLYSRAWNPKNSTQRETFWCFQQGTVLTFPILILSELETEARNQGFVVSSRPPTKEEVLECFKIVGEDIGLSPWGSKFDYGRFTVEELTTPP